MRTAFACLALATPLAFAACGDDAGGHADASIIPRPDAMIDASADEPDADTSEPDADTPDSGTPDAMPGEVRLIISEVVDGTQPGGQPKFVEITNTGAEAADLTGYSLGIFANGGTTLSGLNDAAYVLSGMLEPGDSIAINCGQAADEVEPGDIFASVYGFPPDLTNTDTSFNGDDAIVLFEGAATGDGTNATIVDIYGEIGVDGTGAAWEHLDSYAVRRPGAAAPSQTWVAGEWVVNPVDSLDEATPEQLDAATSPGVHAFGN